MVKSRDYGEILKNKWIVEFNRKPFDKSKTSGFILDFNDDFTLIQLFDRDWFTIDGYCIFQNASVKTFRVYDKEEYFLNEVVKIKQIEPKPVPEISIESWSTILKTVDDNFNLIVVESELIYKNQCNIGKLEKLDKKGFRLKEINTDASWDDSPEKYKFKDLTKVCFSREYENTLWKISESREEK
jgi:hypothetical protein